MKTKVFLNEDNLKLAEIANIFSKTGTGYQNKIEVVHYSNGGVCTTLKINGRWDQVVFRTDHNESYVSTTCIKRDEFPASIANEEILACLANTLKIIPTAN